MNNNNHISQQIAEQERLYKSRNRLSWIFGWSTIVAMIAVPLLCGLANISADTSYTATLFSFFSFFILGSVFQSIAKRHKKKIQRLQEQQRQLNVQNNIAPIIESSCKHCSGLPIGESSLCRLTIFQDMIYFNSGTMEFKLPMDRIINMGISTTSHTEYDLKAHPMRGVIGGLLLGEFGLLWGAEHELVKTETKEYFLVIAYRKDEATKFITLGDVDCKKIISTVSKYVDFQEQNVQL